MCQICDNISNFEYTTRQAWSHSDLNPGNVLYDPDNSKIYFIDFAEASYQFIYHDIFSPLQIELNLCDKVYDTYINLHNNELYRMPCRSNDILRNILKYRQMGVYLKRFIKASDDLRMNPQNSKSVQNNLHKVEFMREQIRQITEIQNSL